MSPDGAPGLAPREKATLLRVARAAIDDRLLRDGSLARVLASSERTARLAAPGAAFVTLETRGPDGGLTLRGCIGTLEPREPLIESVAHNAVQAAFLDPRFPPVGTDERSRLVVSISVLTPMARIPGPEAIVVGRDGVLLEKGASRSVFLPEVASEQGWSVTDLLEHLAKKAGLPRGEWVGAALSTFRTEKLSEGDAAIDGV